MDVEPACESCKIVFIASDAIFATFCGHLFHNICLDTIYNSDTKECPGCKRLCLSSQSMRIYLLFQQETSTPESLIIKCKMLKHELQTNLDNWIESATAMKTRKIQKIAELKEIMKEKENLLKNINEKKKLCSVRKALSDTKNYYDADKLLMKKKPIDTLGTMIVLMKKETARAKEEKTEIRTEMREERKKNEALIAKYKSLREKYEIAVARSVKRGRN